MYTEIQHYNQREFSVAIYRSYDIETTNDSAQQNIDENEFPQQTV